MRKKLLVINGSPRKKGTSYSFGRTLQILAEKSDNNADLVHIIDFFDKKKDFEQAVDAIAHSDVIAIVAPLYVDTLPYPNIWLLEKLYNEHKDILEGKVLFVVGQCGFPDATRIAPLINTCRLFAKQSNMNFVGGLAYGGGAVFNGTPVEDLGKTGERITESFRMALDSAFIGKPIPQQAQEHLRVQLPKWSFRLLALYLNHSSKKMAREYGTDVRRKVYLEDN